MAKRWRSGTLGIRPHTCRVQEQSTQREVSIVYYEDGKKRQRSLGFGVRDEKGRLDSSLQRKAKEEGLRLRLALVREEQEAKTQPKKPTWGVIKAAFKQYELPSLSRKRQEGFQRIFEFGDNRLGQDFDLTQYSPFLHRRIMRDRQTGTIDCRGVRVPEGKRQDVKPTTAQGELLGLAQIAHWAARHRTADGGYLLPRDPFRDEGVRWATAQNQRRPVADDPLVESMLEEMHRGRCVWQLPYLTETLWHSGRRVHAAITLRWEDVLWERGPCGSIHWRAATDKTKRDSVVPINAALREALERLRHEHEQRGLNTPWLFPAPRDAKRPWSENVARDQFVSVEVAVRGYHEPEFGFHALRRGWATRRKHLPRTDVAVAGGWERDSAVLARLYQAPDPDTLHSVVEGGRRIDYHTLPEKSQQEVS